MSKFKVGDRVKMNPAAKVAHEDHVCAKLDGWQGKITERDYQGSWRVKWDNHRKSALLTDDMLMPADTAPVRLIPDEITIDGEKYRRVVEVKEPEKPEPKAGQVWKDPDGEPFVIGEDRNKGELRVHYLQGGKIGGTGSAAHRWMTDKAGTFVANSLADALEQGLLKPSDLR